MRFFNRGNIINEGVIAVVLTIVISLFSIVYNANAKQITNFKFNFLNTVVSDTTFSDTTAFSVDTTSLLDTTSFSDTTFSDTTIVYTYPDSLDLAKLIELKIQEEEELILEMYDSLMIKSNNTLIPLDSLNLHNLAFPPKVYTKRELKRMYRDSVWNYKDSIIRATPRILQTYMFTDTIKNQRMFLWKADPMFNTETVLKPDTTFNDNYSELPYQKYDAGSTYLGISGAAMQYNNYFIRPELKVFPFFNQYLPYSYTPDNIPFYNTKTPYTELCYWGTLLANKQTEEANIKILHTQNFTPSFNFNLLYQRFGANGMLESERTDNRTFAFTGNYLGKKYVAQGGYIFNRIKRNENGGITDPSMVLDTLVDAKIIPVALKEANNVLKRNTLFLTHSYSIPFNFLQKKDSLGRRDSTITDITTAYIGHSSDFSVYSKYYTDNIGLTDSLGRALYNNNFYINPTSSADSLRVLKFENRFFIRLQPWSKNAIVSKLDAGLGYQYLNIYGFKPQFFLQGNSNTAQNNMYMYFGASGIFKKYFMWDGIAVYNYAGYYQNDFSIDGKVRFSSYPKNMKEGIHLTGKIHTSLERPNFFYNNLFTNHYKWENNFDKTTETKIEAILDIPDWKLQAFFGYSLLNNNIYFDSLSVVKQNNTAMSILTAYLQKNFRVWRFHMDNKVLFQVSSNNDVVPLPKVSLNLRYYFEFELVKNVFTAQIGANANFTTKYYMQGYSPALGVFYNQKNEQIGNNPYIDLFVNLQWKRAAIFVKYINMAQGWPTSDYFSAYRYIKPQKTVKFGIYWPFYVK